MTSQTPRLRERLAYHMGFKRLAFTNYDPPNDLFKEISPGVYSRPMGALKTEVVMVFDWRSRLRLLLSGKVQVVNVMWTEELIKVEGDVFRWVVLPPYDKVDPKLRV